MTILATDFVSKNAAPFDHALASITFNELAKEREVFTALKDSLEVIANQMRNAPGKIWSDQGNNLRDDLANQISGMQGEIACHLSLIEEAETGRV